MDKAAVRRERERLLKQKFRRKYRGSAAAHSAIYYAVRDGQLPRPATLLCRTCDSAAELYHHPQNYSKRHRFTVVPLCRKCHYREHRKPKATENAVAH